MSRAALRRVVWLSVTLIAISLSLGYLHVGGTFALWDGATTNSSSPLEAGWIDPPSGLGTPAPSGYGASFTWTPGTHGPVTGQQLWAVDGGTGGSASCGAYALDSTMASASTSSYTSTGSSANNGHWRCYEMVSTSATAWTATAAFTPIRVGLYPKAVAITNHGTSGSIDSGDTIAITFNQNVNAAASTQVCTFQGASGTGVILIGDSTCSNSSTDAYTVGKITGVTVGGSSGSHQGRNTTVSTSNATVTVTVSQNGQTVSGTATFTASASITSSTGSAAACTASYCQVTATGGF
jgi:hypothetical protein